MNFYEKHIGDYTADTVGLTMLEDGAWATGCWTSTTRPARPLPSDKTLSLPSGALPRLGGRGKRPLPSCWTSISPDRDGYTTSAWRPKSPLPGEAAQGEGIC